jgi:sodium transport system ATP-binding protein
VIEVDDVQRRFVQGRGRRARVVQAVAGASFSAADGCITGLLGSNGAGKTTTLRMVAGLLVPDAGRLAVDGIDVVAQPAAALARLGVLSDARGLYPRLTARENIVYYGRLHGMSPAAAASRAEALADTLEMRAAARPPHRRLQPGRTHEDRAGARAGARPAEHHPGRTHQRTGRDGHARAARHAAPAARRQGKCIVFSPTSCRRCSGCATTWW